MSRGPVIRHKPSFVPSIPIVPIGTHRLVLYVMAPDYGRLWTGGGLLGLVYRQSHPGFCGSGDV
jgi:hypothetical protein